MRRILPWVLFVLADLLMLLAGVTMWVSRPQFHGRLDAAELDALPIAPVDQALTFARYRDTTGERALRVTRWEGDRISGIDLTARFVASEPLALLAAAGYDALAAADSPVITIDPGALLLPFTPREHNIGIGANYPEHARESGLEEEPFVFPKIAVPTPFRSDVARAESRLLDYEAEIGLVALTDLAPGAPPQLGLVLANELTDRWALVRSFDRAAPMGTTGFADGKSRDGFAVLGPFLVVPRDVDAFAAGVELRLYLKGRLRQHARGAEMAWPPRTVVQKVFERAALTYRYRDGTVPLLDPPGTIRAGTVIFSGTPAGVIFKPVNLWNPLLYLQPGDEVVILGGPLGLIRSRVVER